MDLLYQNEEVKIVPVFYEDDSANGILHTIHLKDGENINVYYTNLQLLDQRNFLNTPKTPLDYRKEVGTGISLDELKALERPRTVSPLIIDYIIYITASFFA